MLSHLNPPTMAACAAPLQQQQGVGVSDLSFAYPTPAQPASVGLAGGPTRPFIHDCNLDLPRGSRCLVRAVPVCGGVGAGVTTRFLGRKPHPAATR